MMNVLTRATEKKKQRRPCEAGRHWTDVVRSQSTKVYQKPLEVRRETWNGFSSQSQETTTAGTLVLEDGHRNGAFSPSPMDMSGWFLESQNPDRFNMSPVSNMMSHSNTNHNFVLLQRKLLCFFPKNNINIASKISNKVIKKYIFLLFQYV